jgi:uncharacterized protein
MAARRGPERTCVGCNRRRAQAELVRFSGGPGGLRVDLERGEGRGAYCCPDPRCLERIVKRKALQRVLGTELDPLSVQRLRETIHQAVFQKVERLLGLARRARKVVAGSRAVRQALEAGRVELLLLRPDMFPGIERRFREEAERRAVPVMMVRSQTYPEAILGGPSRAAVGVLDDGFAQGIIRTLQYWIPAENGEGSGETEPVRRRGGGTRG